MKVFIYLNDKAIDWENMKKEEQINLADDLNMQGLIPSGYRVVKKNDNDKRTA